MPLLIWSPGGTSTLSTVRRAGAEVLVADSTSDRQPTRAAPVLFFLFFLERRTPAVLPTWSVISSAHGTGAPVARVEYVHPTCTLHGVCCPRTASSVQVSCVLSPLAWVFFFFCPFSPARSVIASRMFLSLYLRMRALHVGVELRSIHVQAYVYLSTCFLVRVYVFLLSEGRTSLAEASVLLL